MASDIWHGRGWLADAAGELSPWQTVYRWFRRFVRLFLFRTIHDLAELWSKCHQPIAMRRWQLCHNKRSLYILIALVKMGPIAVTDDASSNLARGANRDVHSKIV